MKLFVVACLLLGTGCLWANEKSESLDGYGAQVILDPGGEPTGGAIRGTLGHAGLIADFEGNARDLSRPGDLQAPTLPGEQPHLGPATSATGVSVALDIRGSLLGILSDDHRIERYFDLGLDAGAGAGLAFAGAPHQLNGVTSGWYGAWAELGTVPIRRGYLAVTLGVRREVFNQYFFDQTQVFAGLAFRKRERKPIDLTLRD